MKKKLIFHMYIPENFRESSIFVLHFKLLKHFASFFDESLFVLSIDNVNDKKTINFIEHTLVDIGFTNVRFIVHQNDMLRESYTYYHYFVEQFDKFDGVLYFGHTKGLFNEMTGESYYQISRWVGGLYRYMCTDFGYSSLHLSPAYMVYGPFLEECNGDWLTNKYKWVFCGTFMGVACRKFTKLCRSQGIDYLIPLDSRFYSESYLGDVIPLENALGYNLKYVIGNCDFYHRIDDCIKLSYGEEEFAEFNNFMDNIENDTWHFQ